MTGDIRKRTIRPATPEERQRHAEIREQVMGEFPPLDPPHLKPADGGVGSQIRAARESRGLTRFALAERPGVPQSSIVRDIEYGKEAKLSDVYAIAKALGLELTLVESVSGAT